MRKIAENIKLSLAESVIETVFCYKFKLKNSIVFGFATNEQGVDFEGVYYQPNQIISASAIDFSIDLSDEAIEIVLKSNENINQKVIDEKLIEDAVIDIFILIKLENRFEKIDLKRGFVDKIKLSEDIYIIEIASIFKKLDKNIIKSYSTNCSVNFGSKDCGVGVGSYSFDAVITDLIDENIIEINDLAKTERFFNNGVLIHNNINYQIMHSTKNKIVLKSKCNNFSIGDEINLIAGCNKTMEECQKKFKNIINFRGFY